VLFLNITKKYFAKKISFTRPFFQMMERGTEEKSAERSASTLFVSDQKVWKSAYNEKILRNYHI